MRIKLLLFLVAAFAYSSHILAQTNPPAPTSEQSATSQNSVDNISTQLTKVSISLQVFNKNFKAFLEKLPQGLTFNQGFPIKIKSSINTNILMLRFTLKKEMLN